MPENKNNKAKIAFFELEGWEEDLILKNFPAGEVYLSKEKIDASSPEENFEIISVFIDSRINAETLAKFPRLKLITTRSTGYDHIDVAASRARGISVAYVPGYGDNTVAEYAFGLLLSLTRKIYTAVDRVKEETSFSLQGLRGFDLKGKTIGIIGTGRIGREAIKISKGFGLKILAYDIMPKKETASELGFEYVPLEELLNESDFISVHCPLTKETHHLINKNNASLIKKGAFLVNTARGGIVETEALIKVLSDGTLAGAGLDVLEEEGEIKDELNFLKKHPKAEELKTMLENHVLMSMPNVLITPHNAFNTEEALARILETTINNIKEFQAGKPVNLVP